MIIHFNLFWYLKGYELRNSGTGLKQPRQHQMLICKSTLLGVVLRC